jgi:mannonate dehydratase
MPIRLSLGHVDSYDARVAAFAHQLGLSTVQLHNPDNLDDSGPFWRYEELAALQERVTTDGLSIEGLENVPAAQFWKVQRGLPGRDEQLENYRTTIRNMARAGYTVLGHHFMPTYVWRTDMAAPGRGGSLVSSFDLAESERVNMLSAYKLSRVPPVEDPIDAEAMWANYEYFLRAVLPVAEEEGVRLALHPDDPPVDAALGGAARIFISPEALVRAHRLADSPAWGLNFCMGTVSEMGGERAIDAVIDALGPVGGIAYVHFRDVIGTVPSFREGFLGEGNFNPARVLRRLEASGFDGFLIDDHVPAMIGDGDTWGDTSSQAYCSRGRAHAIGYIQGILNALALDARDDRAGEA